MLVPSGIFSDDDDAEDKTAVENLASRLVEFHSKLSKAELIFKFIVEKTKAACDAMPENPCVGASLALACFPNVAYYVCRFVKIATDVIASSVFEAVNMAFEIMAELVAAETISESQAFYGYYYSRATYHNTMQ